MLKIYLLLFIFYSCTSTQEIKGLYTKSKALKSSPEKSRIFLAVFNNLSFDNFDSSKKTFLKYRDILKANYKNNIIFINNKNYIPRELMSNFDISLMNELTYSQILKRLSKTNFYLSSNSYSIKNESPIKYLAQFKKILRNKKMIVFYSLDQLQEQYAANTNGLDDLYLADPIYALNRIQTRNKSLKKEVSIIFINENNNLIDKKFATNRISISNKRIILSNTETQRKKTYFLKQNIASSFSIIELDINESKEVKFIQKEDIQLCSFFWKKSEDCTENNNNSPQGKVPAYFLGEEV